MLVCCLAAGWARGESEVDLELVLAADVSESMTEQIGALQRRGYVDALRAPRVHRAISSGLTGRIALTYLEWGDAGHVAVVRPWTLIASARDAERFAAQLEAGRPAMFLKTSISHALRFSAALFDNNGYAAPRRVIDVSGNGPNNQGEPVDAARDAVVAMGVTINGLPIVTPRTAPRGVFGTGFDHRRLADYYRHCVIGGPGAFLHPVTRTADFTAALIRKLELEIANRPPITRAAFRRVAGAPPC